MKYIFCIVSSLFIFVSCTKSDKETKFEEYNTAPVINSANLPQYDQ